MNPAEESARRCFENGNADLATASLILENPQENLFGIACFHVHQAVEKHLKGYLLYNGEQPPLIHDLKILLDSCTKYNERFSQFGDICKELNPYYIETRYEPGAPEDFSREEAKEIYQKAERVIEFIKSSLD